MTCKSFSTYIQLNTDRNKIQIATVRRTTASQRFWNQGRQTLESERVM